MAQQMEDEPDRERLDLHGSDFPFGFQSGEELFADRDELRIRAAEILAQLEPRRIERVFIAGDLLDEGGRED